MAGTNEKKDAKDSNIIELFIILCPAMLVGIFAGTIMGDPSFGALLGTVIGIVLKVLSDNLNRSEFVTLYGLIGGLGVGVIMFSDVPGGVFVSSMVGLFGGCILGLFFGRKEKKEEANKA